MKPFAINRENSIAFKTIVTDVKEGGLNNLVVSFYKVDGIYSISQAVEKGLNADTLKKNLISKTVTVSYLKPGFFSHFHPMIDTREITELRVGDEIIYTELQNNQYSNNK